jgi:hypothetical protein
MIDLLWCNVPSCDQFRRIFAAFIADVDGAAKQPIPQRTDCGACGSELREVDETLDAIRAVARRRRT